MYAMSLGYLESLSMSSKESTVSLFADWISRHRKNRGYSQQELADSVDVHYTYVSKIELGQKVPSRKLIRKLAAALMPDGGDEAFKDSLIREALRLAYPEDYKEQNRQEIEYATDPELTVIVEAYRNAPPDDKAYLSATARRVAAFNAAREGSVGRRAED